MWLLFGIGAIITAILNVVWSLRHRETKWFQFVGNRNFEFGERSVIDMEKIFRLVLFVLGLAVGGWLGTIFLADFESLKMLAFLAICGVLGAVFHQIDKRITKDE